MLQLYGNARSRAMRCLWMLEERGTMAGQLFGAAAYSRVRERTRLK